MGVDTFFHSLCCHAQFYDHSYLLLDCHRGHTSYEKGIYTHVLSLMVANPFLFMLKDPFNVPFLTSRRNRALLAPQPDGAKADAIISGN